MSKNEQKVANESTQIKVDLNEKEEINGWLNTLSMDLRLLLVEDSLSLDLWADEDSS